VSGTPSLYRRHRPRSFADVVGQEHVVRTLRNAVEQDKVHHAYLFVGSRGTGKTSMAKILAACLNCVNGGPTVEPCGQCESCVAIANASSLDVIEMDAASNNSVDDIRDLRESVAYAPVSGRSKVYILDEAHMLTNQAWNAFLKTLEEPPPNTIFVLATTEASKILPTVVDRCHRFDFGRPTVEQLAAVVRRVAEHETIEIPADAVALLARQATGSFRDALGTLEQLVTYSGPTIVLEDVLAVLGVADADLLFGALDAVAGNDPRAALLCAARLADSGRDVSQFLRDLETHARELLLVQTLGGVPAELAVTPDRDARLAEQAGRVRGADATRVLDLLAAAMRAVKDGADARTQLELALVKAAAPEVDASTRALLARIERLEAALAAGPPAAAPAPVPLVAASALPEVPAPPPQAPTPPVFERAPGAQAPVREPAPVRSVERAPGAQAPVREPAPALSAEPTPEPVAAALAAAEHASAQAPVAEPAVAVVERPGGSPQDLVIDVASLVDLWPAVLKSVSERNQVLAVCLADARAVALDGTTLTVALDESEGFKCRKADDPVNRAALAEAIRSLTGVQPRVRFELRALKELDAAAVGFAAPEPPSEDEIIARFKEEFDAEEILDDPETAPVGAPAQQEGQP
jgi:DNA polymerase-3 subunit gamma/tau